MFGATNKKISKVFATTFDDYGSVIIGDYTSTNIEIWFESTYQEQRRPNGDIYIIDAIAILEFSYLIIEGSIIEIENNNYKVESIRKLEDFSKNKRIELSLKMEVWEWL